MPESVEDAVRDELLKYGVSVIRVSNRGKHRRLYFVHGGKEQFFVASLSPSDHRAHLNARSDVRKILGVKKDIRKNPDRKPRRKRIVAVPKPSGMDPGKDWQAILAVHPLTDWKAALWWRIKRLMRIT